MGRCMDQLWAITPHGSNLRDTGWESVRGSVSGSVWGNLRSFERLGSLELEGVRAWETSRPKVLANGKRRYRRLSRLGSLLASGKRRCRKLSRLSSPDYDATFPIMVYLQGHCRIKGQAAIWGTIELCGKN